MKINKIFVCFLIFLLLIPSFSFASDEGIMPLYYDENDLTLRYEYIYNQILTKTGYNIKLYNGVVFYDEYANCYRVVSASIENADNINFGFTENYLDCIFWNGTSHTIGLYLFSVFSDGEVDSKFETIFNGKNIYLTNLYKLNCFTQFNYMFGICNCTSGHWFNQYNIWSNDTTYFTKAMSTNPYVVYDESNTNFIIDNCLVINAGNTLVSNNYIIPFVLQICKDETFEIVNTITLDINNSYYDNSSNCFKLPLTFLSNYVSENGNYHFYIELFWSQFYYRYEEVVMSYDINTGFECVYTPSIPDSTDKIVDSIGDMSNTISSGLNQVNETNKGIWQTIKDILSYINPFSENFFVYKLIELLFDMLKSLFIPSDDFFTNWLDDLNAYFGECFGILYFPFEMLIDFLNKINTIDTTEPIINIPSFDIDFIGYKATFFDGYTYNFNDLLLNDTFKNIHTIYLGVVDVILWLSVVYLASKCIKTILGGMSDEIIDDATSNEKSYKQYEQYQNNKQRYKNENGK